VRGYTHSIIYKGIQTKREESPPADYQGCRRHGQARVALSDSYQPSRPAILRWLPYTATVASDPTAIPLYTMNWW